MTKPEAIKAMSEIEAVCAKYGLWYNVEMHKKPDLRMILIKEIAIKVTDGDHNMK